MICAFQVYIDTVGDPGKYEAKMSKNFPSIKFVVAKKADSLYPVVSGASIAAKVFNSLLKLHQYTIMFYCLLKIFNPTFQVTRDRAVRDWVLDETADNIHRNFGSGYPAGESVMSTSHMILSIILIYIVIIINMFLFLC